MPRRTSRSIGASFVTLAAWAATARAQVDLPKVDFSSLGTVGVVGSFAGLSFWDANSSDSVYTPAAATIVSRSSSGDLRQVGATNDGGNISALCQTPRGTLYIGGAFSAINGVQVSNIASYDPSTDVFSALGPGLDGPVLALSCNGTSVYAGGEFRGPHGEASNPGYAGHVAAWSIVGSTWSPLPFSGLNGAVETIVASEDGRSLFFGGSFSTTFSNSSLSTNFSSSDVAGQIPSLGSSLVPISLNQSDYWASPTTYTSGFGRPEYTFCPRHGDGIGASWLLVDNQAGFFIARLYRPIRARGIRLGNTFYEGRGTQNFSVVSIPDNTVLELTYRSDPSDPSSPLATCAANCVLAHNESIPYQDFLFPDDTLLTGFQLNIFGWYGDSGGLHLLQLLSDGAYAYAVQSNNLAPCRNGLGAMSPSTTSLNGDWNRTAAVSTIPGTYEEVMVAYVQGGTTPSDAQSIVWTPFVGSDGEYQMYLVTPGCQEQGTCAERTSVSVTVTPAGNLGASQTTVIDQQAKKETSTLIYSGLLTSSDQTSGGVTVSLGLADGGAPARGQTYEMVANLVSLVANSTDGASGLAARPISGRGLFEFPLIDSGVYGDAVAGTSTLNATSILINATGIDELSFSLNEAAVVTSIISTGSGPETRVFLAGNFTYTRGQTTTANILSYSSKAALVSPGGGLNGPVTSIVALDGYLYAAGNFGATMDASTTGLAGTARWRYDSADAKWEAVGPAQDLGYDVRQLGVLAGSATNKTIAAVGLGPRGFATYDPSLSAWNRIQAGLVIGNLTAIGSASNLVNETAPTYLAGNIIAISDSIAPGGAMLSRARDGTPRLTSFDYELAESTSTSSANAAGSATTRSRVRRSKMHVVARALVNEVVSALSNRSGRRLDKRAPAAPLDITLPSAIQTSMAGQVLTGTFWTNGSTELMLLGGNFATSSGASNIALYDAKARSLSSLPGVAVVGAVTAVAVFNDQAWIGGNFTSGQDRQGLITYDLKNRQLDDSQPGLQGYAGDIPVVNVIAQRPGHDSQFIVAGAFANAGSLYCQSICSWDASTKQWSSLSGGLQGVVSSLDFAGDNSDILIAAGQFSLNGQTSYLAQWYFKNSTWVALGAPSAIPGPATAMTTDNGQQDKIFVAGQMTDGNAYLMHYNGNAWTNLNNGTLGPESGVQQLVFVPMSDRHSSNEIMETNRMLLVSGDLAVNGTSVSSALFDGETWHPYLVSTASDGASGIISQLFYSVKNFNLSNASHLSVAVVILISIAIALGVVFLLVLIGLLIALARRRDEPQYPGPPVDTRSTDGRSFQQPEPKAPTSLLATVGAATAVLLDGRNEKNAKVAATMSATNHHLNYDADQDQDSLDDGGDTSYDSHIFEGGPSAARARYSFTKETEGELSVRSGEDLTILDSTSSPDWFLVANSRGERGLMPASYVA